jgi:hypothetical protein
MGLFSKKEATNTGAQMPPAPPVNEAGANQIPEPTPSVKNLSNPPAPGGSLDDIKNQVAGSEQPALEQQVQTSEVNMPSNNEMSLEDDDSLFDFSELGVDSPIQSEETFTPASVEEEKDVSYSESELKFMNEDKHKVNSNETYFVTTRQFKALLEIVESVKTKVKEASETHLRLLDMKAEEDIEYENLRKDFEFIESKLYEVDSIIFEN